MASNRERQEAHPNTRHLIVSCRVNAEELDTIRRAVPSGVSQNQWIRDALLAAATGE